MQGFSWSQLHNGSLYYSHWCNGWIKALCVTAKAHQLRKWEGLVGIDLRCIFYLCVCVCANRAGGHHWQSLSPRMCLNTEGRCYWRVCVSVLHIWGPIQTSTGTRSTVWVGKTFSPITLGLSSCWTPGCWDFSHHRSESEPRGRIGGGQRGVWWRKWYQDNECKAEQNIRVFRLE